ncbi:P-loop containing nucleoside triphosphate hydrolase protein [Serendipita vermifera]|nr:P-loop containing nucleoside triphosphate hydrolase protein [Serendipita vermifera]
MVVLDGLASLPQAQSWSVNSLIKFKERALVELMKLVSIDWDLPKDYPVVSSVDTFGVGPFKVALGNHSPPKLEFELQAPTTLENCKRVLRACQLNKPILLEGSPGVGKTSLIIALAALTSHNLCRVNLSDQTDLMDLFGSDLPVEGAEAGEFAWRDAAFLQAMQQGDWVLLDEMNLAPQAVLEGLNSVLDHRGTVFLPELDRTFTCHPDFRLFAAQNPVQQGGGRKGLPKSFVNRFTKVYLDDLNANDLLIIANRLHPDWSKHQLRQMITFNSKVHEETTVLKTMGRQGSPWEFNLRDVMRWLAMFQNPSLLEVSPLNPTEFLPEIYLERFRSSADRDRTCLLVEDIFAEKMRKRCTHMDLSSQWTQFGHALIHQQPSWNQIPQPPIALQSHSIALESASKCIEKGWLIILVSNVGAGKTSLIRHLAARYGSRVIEFSANSATDTSDILGSFEQEDTILCASTLIDQDFKLLDEDAVSNLLETFGNLENTREATNSQERRDGKGRFTWVDGPLIRSIKEGSWFILDNANLCNPSVLDRLNSLCEMGGSLSLTERGLINGEVETIRPHPNFRLIMTMDPTNGELSRAMRNRGMEIYLEPSHSDEDQLQMNLFRRDYSLVHPPYKELIRLNHVPGYTSFGRMQPLLRLLPNFMAMELDAQVRFLLQITRQGNHAILRRLPHLGDVRNSLSAFLEIYDNLLTCQYEGFKETGLPPSFLYSQALEMRLNPNLVERAKHSRILTSIEWRSCCIYIAWRISHSSRRILNKTEQESILSVSEKFALNKAVMGQVPVEVQTIFPVITRCRTLLLELIQRPVPIADISTCSDFIELWEYANEVTQKSTLSYSLWLSVLKRMETIIQNYNNAEVNHAVSAALESLRLRSGLLMESIWSSHKPYFDGKLRSKWLIHAIEGSKETFPSTNAKVALRNQAIDLAALLVLTEGIQRISTEELLATKPLDPSTEVTALSTLLLLKLLMGISQKVVYSA